MKISSNALEILRKRYLLRDSQGRIIETPSQMFKRVAKAVAAADGNRRKTEQEFYEMMINLEFLPNSPTLMNAGTKLGQLNACFVLPIEDSIDGIFLSLRNMAKIHQSGGGTGFNFSKIRPKGDIVMSTKGIASGPVSFMKIFDKATEVIKQGGKRRGANIGILNMDHPDIAEFITAKKEDVLRNFNISAAVSDKFMQAVEKNKDWSLINPRNKKIVKKIKARKLFNLIAEMAWKTGDPGVIFIDEVNRKHPLLEKIESTNPCAEQPLLPNESCNLGSINLSKMVKDSEVDWQKLRKTIRTAVHFLDNIIDISKFPLKKIEKKTKQTRKIGLGVMGFAEMLIKLGIRYDSDESVKIAEKVMKFITKEARIKSEGLGKKKGSFSLFKKSKLKKRYRAMRNATVTTIAPTGSISIIAGTSSGIEPLFAVKFKRRIIGGKIFTEINQLYKSGKYDKKLFVAAMDIKPEYHVKIQAAFQKYTDNAVSKTVNLRNNAAKNDVKKVFMLAYKLRCKGITVYRHGSKKEQVLTVCPTCK